MENVENGENRICLPMIISELRLIVLGVIKKDG
jgi:hypothetical protein